MALRDLLRKHLVAAWSETLSGAYADGLINSERGLQVHFCAALIEQFKEDGVKRKLFIEPMITFDDGERRHPDIVVCNARRIICVVELKYKPKVRPSVASVEKDINTLLRMSKTPNALTLKNERFLGPIDPRTYELAQDAVLCWAGIYSGKLINLPPENVRAIGTRFERLDGLTSKTANPRFERA